ncbi:MAG: hypothetical protein OJF48_001172 [Afipia sp.]|nr:MAG: hypothetical protein OJF48_001172 [Afipia sp.]
MQQRLLNVAALAMGLLVVSRAGIVVTAPAVPLPAANR